MTTFALIRRAGVPAAAVALLSLTACSGASGTSASPTVTATVTVTAPASPAEPSADPAAAESPAADAPTGSAATPAPSRPGKAGPPITDATPAPFGGTIQSDPGHDFTKGLSPSSNGVVRAQLVAMHDENVAEYRPVKFVKEYGGSTTGHFEGPPEGDVTAFAAPIAKNVTFLSAVGCDGKDQTIDSRYLGTQRCSRDTLVLRADKGDLWALVTVDGGQIVKVTEIYVA
ncbi:hypothetical protein [Microbispora sp. H11081]|uniref:hypothetical protein n=1 Tax=Microbispora sp. H11081 TaxID=2729107 RepID=UPI0014763F92|nr:hypothetical protein [Microbispora sp. H11081]